MREREPPRKPRYLKLFFFRYCPKEERCPWCPCAMSVASILTKSPLVVFVSSGCPYCDMAEEALDKARIPVRTRRSHLTSFLPSHTHHIIHQHKGYFLYPCLSPSSSHCPLAAPFTILSLARTACSTNESRRRGSSAAS